MKQILQDRDFRNHLIAYVAVNLLLLAVNLLSTPAKLWFVWPLLGWGIGLVAHGAATYRRMSASAISRKAPHETPGP